MTVATTTETTSHTLDVPGATLAYDIRPNDASGLRPLFAIGAPMGAAGFASLAKRFADRTVITYDPRGTERSVVGDPTTRIDAVVHADDVHRVIEAVGLGPVDMFASSGGAVTALALVASQPSDVRTLVAHEPPLASLLPDREHALAACRAIHETYMARGSNAGMAHFIAVVMHRGPFTADVAAQPAPDPRMFGMPADDDGQRTDAMLSQTILTIPAYEPDFSALRAAKTRIVIAAGEDSDGEMAQRGAFAVAQQLGIEMVLFPGGHGGFLGGEYGQMGKPDEFAAKLREVLDR
jgi:pimeloyl-ACP methyl ester carboxylesterase